MNIIVPFKCEKCSIYGTAEIGLEMPGDLNIGPKARFIIGKCPNQICEKGDLIVPPGHYRQHEGMMIYAGEFRPILIKISWWNRVKNFLSKVF